MKDYLIIDRSKWRTGAYGNNKTGKGETYLLNEEGYMCCLGFRCEQMGVPRNVLFGIGLPSTIKKYNIPDLVQDNGQDTFFTRQAMEINDTPNTLRSTREKEIKKHFANIDVIVKFINRYEK